MTRTFNFPVQLVLCPLIGAIAAGCTAVVKPSENAPAVAAVVQRIIESTLDSACYKVVQGAVPETSLLLDQKWDKIFYTGSARVGTIIAKKAAETLTPVTLELGGRNPAIVTKHANCYTATRRLLWGKTLNAGQVCISQNYTLVDETVLDQFITELKTAISEFYPNGAQSSPDYAHIVNRESFDRITSLLSSSEGKVLAGGTSDPSTLFIAPTIVLLSSPTDPILSSESFGPLLPILPYSSLDSAIKLANDIHCTPLALAAFGSSTEYAQILNEIRSGGASLNDNYLHGSLPTLPFGGVGDSGQGNYRGRASFECFTHRRTVTNTPNWVEGLLKVRYPPFTDANLKKMRQLTATTPWFDREGTVTVTWLGWLLRLGAEGNAGGVARYVVLVLGKSSNELVDFRTLLTFDSRDWIETLLALDSPQNHFSLMQLFHGNIVPLSLSDGRSILSSVSKSTCAVPWRKAITLRHEARVHDASWLCEGTMIRPRRSGSIEVGQITQCQPGTSTLVDHLSLIYCR